MEVSVSSSVGATIDSVYLLMSNRQKCNDILRKQEYSTNDIMDFLISLHLVLEIGINSFFRTAISIGNKKVPDKKTMYEDLDGVSYCDKVTSYIYFGKFDFEKCDDEVKKHYKIIKKMKQFGEMRNKLLHGHSVSSHSADGKEKQSTLKKKISVETMQSQISLFKDIVDGVVFFFRNWESSINKSGKDALQGQYLDKKFLEFY